jgi:hypothetical protein
VNLPVHSTNHTCSKASPAKEPTNAAKLFFVGIKKFSANGYFRFTLLSTFISVLSDKSFFLKYLLEVTVAA